MSTIIAENISDGTETLPMIFAIEGASKAGASWNGQGTVTLVQSQNTSSITDVATGRTDHGFTNSFANANYTFGGGCNFTNAATAGLVTQNSSSAKTTSTIGINAGNSSNAEAADFTINGFNSFGDLA